MKSKVVFFLKRMLAGFVMGVGGILPGVSGGIMAVSMGIYEPMIAALYGFFKNAKRNAVFLLPLILGGALGLLGTSNLVEWFIVNYRFPVMYLFIGLVAGGIPTIIREGNAECGFKKRYLIAIAVGAAFILTFAWLSSKAPDGAKLPINFFTGLLAGGILAFGTIIPGISTSFILIFLGIYESLLGAVNRSVKALVGIGSFASADIVVLLGLALGFAVGAVLLIIFVKGMFDRHHGIAYYAVLGFLVSSMALIFPGFRWDWVQLLSAVLLVGGFVLALLMERGMSAASHGEQPESAADGGK